MNYLQLPIAILPHLRRLSGVQAAIWADAWTWGQQEAQAFRTNEQYAQMFGTTVKSISRSIATMREMGMLESRMVNGRQRILVACIPTNVHPHERPSTGTSIPMNVHAASTPTSMQHPHKRPCSIPTNVHQVYHVVEQEVNHSVEKKVAPPKKESTPKDLQTVIDAFVEAGQPADMAEAFFNYYESIGWRVGKARTPMKDWKASARGWIQRETKYQDERNKSANRARGHGRADVKLDPASTLEWLKSPRRNHGYY